MKPTVVLSAVLAVVICSRSGHAWDNNFDAPLHKVCPSGQALYQVRSYHHDHYEDRRWSFGCRSWSALSRGQTSSWYYNQNPWDGVLNFKCSDKMSGSVACGVKSYHNDKREDRIWSFKCCKPNSSLICSGWKSYALTGYINSFDGKLNWQTPSSRQFINGFYSYHHDHYEDRRWRVFYGEPKCSDRCACSGSYDSNWIVSRIDYNLDHFTTVPGGTVTLVSKNIDNDSSKITAQISVVASSTVTKTSTFSKSVGASTSITNRFKVRVPVFGGVGTSLTLGASYTHTWGKQETVTETISKIFVVTAPPNTHAVVKAIMTKSTIKDVPFTMTLRHKTLGCQCHVKGTWSGADYHNLRLSIKDKEGRAMDMAVQEQLS